MDRTLKQCMWGRTSRMMLGASVVPPRRRCRGVVAYSAAPACIIAITTRRYISVALIMQSYHCTCYASLLVSSRLGGEYRVLGHLSAFTRMLEAISTYNKTLKPAFEQLVADANTFRMLNRGQRVLYHVFHV